MAKILLVEDNALVSNYMIDALRQAGHTSDVARNVRQAEHLLKDGRFDLVVTDWVLPAPPSANPLDPYLMSDHPTGLITHIRTEYPGVPVIICSEGDSPPVKGSPIKNTYVGTPIMDAINGVPKDAHVKKPQNLEDCATLIGTINKLLQQRRGSRPSGQERER